MIPGTRIGSYEIVAVIGAGGMGEVYRARDTKLGREVALKVLPEAFASDAERLARFEREAKLLASLNHPNIAAIYGFEDSSGTGTPARALVMELVEGQTLAERIAGAAAVSKTGTGRVSGSVGAGAVSPSGTQKARFKPAPATRAGIPLDETLPIARQIAEGLEYAHERGIVHRDLKPANVKITPDGLVKILDFGLAKALAGETAAADPSTSPTLSHLATQAGIILGTAAYMAPEQAKGKPVDRRADIWAFGCVLYEMLVGRPAFDGETVTDILAAVVMKEPDWSALPEATPRAIRTLLTRCLKKDPKQRLRDIGEARIAIEETIAGHAESEPSASATQAVSAPVARGRGALVWGIAGLVAGAAIIAAVWFVTQKPPAPATPVALSIQIPQNHPFLNDLSSIAITPNGRQIAYVTGSEDGSSQIWIRSLGDFAARPVAGTEGAHSPFFSPDGQWLGYFANGKLEKISLAGGVPQVLCSGTAGNGSATWAPGGTIYFSGGFGALLRVSGDGGDCRHILSPNASTGAVAIGQPSILPGGRSLLVAVENGFGGQQSNVAVLSLKTRKLKILLQDATNPSYVAPGYLVFGRAGTLWGAPFDAKSLQLAGPPAPLVSGVADNEGGTFDQFAVSESGMLIYAPGSEAHPEREIVETDRSGNAQVISTSPRPYEDLSLSPDGKRLTLTIEGSLWNVWTFDLATKTLARLTFQDDNRDPFWTADGKDIAYTSLRNGRWGIYEKAADGSGQERLLFHSPVWSVVTSFSPDGRTMAFFQDDPATGADIFLLPLDPLGKPRVFLRTPASEWFAQFSPGGRWIAYESNESGRSEIYVQPAAATGGKWQISSGGGMRPVWPKDDHEIFYRNAGKLMAVPVQTSPTFSAGTPHMLFQDNYFSSGHDFDATPDGKHFFFIKSLTEASAPTELHVILNWTKGLAARIRPAP